MNLEQATELLKESILERYSVTLSRASDNENFDNLLKLDSTLFYSLFKNFHNSALGEFTEKLSIFESLNYNIEDDGELNFIYVEYCYEMEEVSKILGRKHIVTHREYFILEREWEYITKELILSNLITKNKNIKIKEIYGNLFGWDDLKWFAEFVQPRLTGNMLNYQLEQTLSVKDRRKYIGEWRQKEELIKMFIAERTRNHRHSRNFENFVDREEVL